MAEIDIQAKFDVSDVKKGTEEYIENINKVRQVTEFASANIGASLKALKETTRRQMEEMKNAITAFSSSIGDQKNVIKGLEAEIKNLQAALKGASAGEMQKSIGSDLNIARKALEEEKAALVSLQNQQNASKNTLAELRQQYAQHTAQIKEATASNKLYASVLEVLPKPIQGAISATVNFTKASLALISTPLGAVLMALVAAYQAVSTWATYSKEGQDALAASSAFLSGIMNSLRETVLEAGEAIYMAFNDPKQAVINLWESIKNNLVKRIEGLGGVFKAFGKILSSGFTSGYADLADAFIQVNTGVEDFSQKAKDYIAKTEEMAVKTRKLQEEETKLNDAKRAASKKLVEYDQKIAEAKEKSTKQELSNSERKKATEEAKRLIQEKYDLEKKLGDEELRIQRARMELFKKTNQDYDKEAALEVKLLKLENDRENQLRALGSTSGAMSREIISAHEKISQELLSLQQQNQQAKIDLMAEGSAKELAQIQSDYQKKLAEIKKLADDWAAAQGGTLTPQQTVEVSVAYSNAKKTKEKGESNILKKQVEEEQRTMQEYIKEYGTYQEKRLIITRQYAEKIAEAQTPGEKLSLQKQQEKELQDLDQSMLEQTDLWKRLFSDASDHTNKYISQIISDTEKLVKYIQGEKDIQLPDFITQEQIESLKKDPEKVKALLEELKKKQEVLNTRNPFKGMIDGFKDLANAGGDAEKQMAAINDIIGSMNGAASIIGSIGDALDSMGIKAGSVFNDVANVVSETASMAQAGASLGGPIGAAIGAGVGLATSLTKLFSAKHDAKRDKKIEQIQKQVDGLDKEYAKLQKTTTSSYSGKKAASIDTESENLKKQNELIQQQVEEERSKKKTDQGKINQWNEAIEANNVLIEKNKELRIDAIMGADIQSAIEDFANAYLEAWEAGDKAAGKSKDVAKKMIKGIITELLKSNLQTSVGKFREKLAEAMKDNYISGLEQAELDRLQAEMEKITDDTLTGTEKYFQDNEIKTPNSQIGAISEKITEQTASEMTGILRGSYDTLKGIDQKILNLHESYQYAMAASNGILTRIATNTGTSATNTTEMLSEIKSLRVDVQSLKDTRKYI